MPALSEWKTNAVSNRRGALFLLLLGVILSAILFVTLAISASENQRQFVNEPLHSAMEASGALCAVLMSIFLMRGKMEQDVERYSPPAMGFLSMGILDAFHSICCRGNPFILSTPLPVLREE